MKPRASTTHAAAAAVRQKARSMTSLRRPRDVAGAAGLPWPLASPVSADGLGAALAARAAVASAAMRDCIRARRDDGAVSRPIVLRTAALNAGSSNSLWF